MVVFDGPWSSLTPVTKLSNFLHQAKETYFIPVMPLTWCACFSVPCSAAFPFWCSTCWVQLLARLYFSAGWSWLLLNLEKGGTRWQHKVSKWGSPFAGALYCRSLHVCRGSCVIHHTGAPSVMRPSGLNGKTKDAQWDLLRTKFTGSQWANLKGFEWRK